MSEKISIIFTLDSALNVYRIVEVVKADLVRGSGEDGKHSPMVDSIELVDSIESAGRVLNLSDHLASKFKIWAKSFPLNSVTEMGLCVGQNAGFTDLRMLFMWMQTWQQFSADHRELWVSQLNASFLQEAVFQEKIPDSLSTNLQNLRSHSSPDLQYSRPPRIG